MENAPISKNQLCWVIIRVFAIILIYNGVMALPASLTAILAVVKMGKPGVAVVSALLVFAIPATLITIGVKLLTGGVRLHAILMRGARPITSQAQALQETEPNQGLKAERNL